MIRNRVEFASLLAENKNKFFSLKVKEETIICRFSSYINGRFIVQTKNKHRIVNFDDVVEVKSKGIVYVIKK
jgi:hypothetical protein